MREKSLVYQVGDEVFAAQDLLGLAQALLA